MAKTQWPASAPFGILTPALQEAYWGTNASTGHTHDGSDADGSVPKIDLTSHVTGVLPISNTDILEWTEFGVDVTSGYFDTPVVDAKWDYALIRDMVFIYVKTELKGEHSVVDSFEISPNGGNWPADIVPTNLQFVGGLNLAPCAVNTEMRMGQITIPASSTLNWALKITDNNAILGSDHFGTTSTVQKSIFRQTFSYRKA